jgi:hypothetical protein
MVRQLLERLVMPGTKAEAKPKATVIIDRFAWFFHCMLVSPPFDGSLDNDGNGSCQE